MHTYLNSGSKKFCYGKSSRVKKAHVEWGHERECLSRNMRKKENPGYICRGQ